VTTKAQYRSAALIVRDIAHHVEEKREQRGLSIRVAAEQAGVNYQSLNNYLKRGIAPGGENVQALLEWLAS
jgi:lambda repressor-like predicted transcriptional regulator